jgi:spermidine/putrescine transport system permease protein
MTSDRVRKFFTLFFVFGFFAYLFGPLIIMGLTAFNSSAFPRVTPWECFSVEWFDVLVNDDKLVKGLRNSIFISLGVVALSVPLGLAGALMLSQVKDRIRPWYYTIIISPILVPGVVLGISTLLFWDRVGSMFGASREGIFYNGFFLTIMGHATFISAYTMLIFISRLQRFDSVQEEAALDLGATHVQTFRKILLPFLKPAIASAAVLAFLASFENYNTTVFTILSESTITTFLAAKVRYGINPSVSALAVSIVVITLLGAALHEMLKRREIKAAKESDMIAKGTLKEHSKNVKRGFFAQPALYMILAVFVSGVGTTYFAGTMGVGECKVRVKAERQKLIQERVHLQQQKAMFREAGKKAAASEAVNKPTEDKSNRPGVSSSFGNIFSTDNLEDQSGTGTKKPIVPVAPTAPKGMGGGLFSPGNLKKQSGSE